MTMTTKQVVATIKKFDDCNGDADAIHELFKAIKADDFPSLFADNETAERDDNPDDFRAQVVRHVWNTRCKDNAEIAEFLQWHGDDGKPSAKAVGSYVTNRLKKPIKDRIDDANGMMKLLREKLESPDDEKTTIEIAKRDEDGEIELDENEVPVKIVLPVADLIAQIETKRNLLQKKHDSIVRSRRGKKKEPQTLDEKLSALDTMIGNFV